MLNQRDSGRHLALLGSVMLLCSATIIIGIISTALYFHFALGRPLDYLLHTTPLPAVASLTWLFTVGGSAASIVAIVIYGFRARWFWRCLVATSVLWLFAPPIHFVIGLISLVVLIGAQRAFPKTEVPLVAAP